METLGETLRFFRIPEDLCAVKASVMLVLVFAVVLALTGCEGLRAASCKVRKMGGHRLSS